MAQATKLFDLSNRLSTPTGRPLMGRPPALPVVAAPPPLPPVEAPDQDIAGLRKLVRPQLPSHLSHPAAAPRRLRGAAPLARHEAQAPALRNGPAAAASHAEALYFQKQMQAQTPMVFVLEDGEHLCGVVEWFDRDTIKIRNRTRTLIFKRSIKYLYKAEEGSKTSH